MHFQPRNKTSSFQPMNKRSLNLSLYNYLLLNGHIPHGSGNILNKSQILHELRIFPNTYYYYKKQFEIAVLRDYLINKKPIGGERKEVQIDESLFNKRKFHKGRYKEPIWVFGGVEAESSKCFFSYR
ncbi:hypothetical protein EQH57_0350 [Dictyocoela roeselum]|nr:hypothetical protein EQH57_0350 [Dictyocoela roeselum]